MSEQVTKIYGPPGTGKTTRLTAVAVKAAQLVGPDQLCAITFTRAGADELKQRIAAALGIPLPPDPWERRKLLEQRLPWVGTIHSLAFKRMGRPPTLKAKDLSLFIAQMGGHASGALSDVDDQEGYTWAEPGRDEIEAALAVYAGARHRLVPIRVAYDLVPWGYRGPNVTLERCQVIAEAYRAYKRDIGKIDFEDMLEVGGSLSIPARVILADEVQDNSPLLWDVVDHWIGERKAYLAGDPYQAIYLFSGAAPGLFINHPGVLFPLGDSRRLTERASQSAQQILRQAGVLEGEWLGTWTGTGAGEHTDESVFWLARTARLLGPVYDELQHSGVPYASLRGGGPLKTKAAQGFKALIQMRRTGIISAQGWATLMAESETSYLPAGEKARSARLAAAEPDAELYVEDLRQRMSGPITGEGLGLKHGAYFERVLAEHGVAAFVMEPRVRVGTIHAAKGKEADIVHLIDSWGTLPYRSATSGPEGALAEGCVAYVATTRHRVSLVLEPGSEGSPYPGF